MLYLIEVEDEEIGVLSVSDIFRGARERLASIGADSPVFGKLMRSIFSRYLGAQERSAGEDLSLADVFGGNRLMADFTAELATPAILHALADAEHLPVPIIGGGEAPACLAARKARQFSKLVNGGFASPHARAFQRSPWYDVFVFMASTRRTGHALLDLPHARFTDSDDGASSGEEQLVIPETPVRGPDVIVDGMQELEDFLQNLE